NYELDESVVNAVINAGKGHNTLVYDGIQAETENNGYDFHVGASGIQIYQYGVGVSSTSGFTRTIAYKNMRDVELIAPASRNSLCAAGGPAGSPGTATPASGAPARLPPARPGALYPTYTTHTGPPASNTIHVNASTLVSNHGLSIFGYSGSDSLVI